MKPPIPAPDSVPLPPSNAAKIHAPKPKGLATATIFLVLFSLSGFLSMDEADGSMQSQIAFFAIVAIFFHWKFWQGRNWARILTLIGSIATILLAPYDWTNSGLLERIVAILDAIFSLWLLFWLTRPHIVAFFKQNGFEPQR